MQEHKLAARLSAIRRSSEKMEVLRPYDSSQLLEQTMAAEASIPYKLPVQPKTLDDIFADDVFALLEDGEEARNLFQLKHIHAPSDRAAADFVAKRRPCKDFQRFEEEFKTVQKDLSEGKRKLLTFKEDNLREGEFYVHNGILLLLQKVDYQEKIQAFKSGSRLRKDGRTRVIFENGTESNMLYRSLYKALLDNGKALSTNEEMVAQELTMRFNEITHEDQVTGYIYILRSKSNDPQVRQIKNLYKIGYSTTPVEERIKNARLEPTYLMAEVDIISVFQCYNLNPHRFEQLLHRFFGEIALKVDIFDQNRQRITPREWFVAPLPVIEKAIRFIISGEIVHYRYDALKEQIIER